MSDDLAAWRGLLTDSFERISNLVADLTDGLSPEVATYRPDPQANPIAWLIWHLSRIQDDHLAGLTGNRQVWTTQGWARRFDLPFPDSAHGYGQSAADVAKVQVPAELLAGYHAAVHEACLGYVAEMTAGELERVVDTRWDPPVTASVRLVSVLGDCLQHAGQAAYVRGLAQRAGL